MNESDDEEFMPYNHNRICCTLNNSMAVSHNGDIYVWGKANQGLFNEAQNSTFKTYPAKLQLPKRYPFYKVIHISCGLNHATAILECQLAKELKDMKYVKKDEEKEILNKIRHHVVTTKKDMFEYSETRDNKKTIKQQKNRYITQKEFDLMLEDYKNAVGSDQFDQLREDSFKKYFEKDRETIDFIAFYYQIMQPLRPKYRAVVWGNGSHGRLGLTIEQAKLNKMHIKSNHSERISHNSEHTDEEEPSKINNDEQPSMEKSSSTQVVKSIPAGQRGKASKIKQDINFIVSITELSIRELQKLVIFAKLSCGHHHTLGLSDSKELYSWGMGSQGCLGTGQINDEYTPRKIQVNELKSSIRDICSGAFHCLVMTESFEVFSWGVNSRGQLGIGNTKMQLSPIEVGYFTRKQILPSILAAGDQHSAVITKDHELFTWGNGDYFRLGHGICMDELEPKKVEVLQDVYVESVACGTNHTLCITNEGFVYSWGSGMNGKLGTMNNNKDQILPQRCGIDSQSFRDHSFYQVAAGTLHSMALTSSGHLFTWGSNKNGILGVMLSRGTDFVAVPSRVDQGQDTKSQKFFKTSFFKIMEEHESKFTKVQHLSIYQNALAYGSINQQILELKLKSVEICKTHCIFRYVVCGENNSFFITNEGKVYGCGSTQHGLLMKNPEQQCNFQQNYPIDDQNQFSEILKHAMFQPMELTYFSKTVVNFISCSYNHAIAITKKGAAFCWGLNQHFQLGLGFSSAYITTPIRLLGALEQKKIVMACTGQKYSAVLTDQGEVWTFGTSDAGVLGHEKKNYYIIQEPRMINDIPAMSYICCSTQTMVAIQDFKQRIWVWGNNQYGQLGISLARPDIIGAFEQGDSEEEGKKGKKKVKDDHEQKLLEERKKEKKHLEKQLDHMKNPENYIIYKPIVNIIKVGQSEIYINQVACGAFHTLVLATDGMVFAAGLERYAGLGRQKEHNEADEDDFQEEEKDYNDKLKKYFDHFAALPELEGKRVICIAAHEHHSLAITKEFDIYGWGATKCGKLLQTQNLPTKSKKKFDANVQETILPLKIEMPTRGRASHAKHFIDSYKWTLVTCGPNHSMALTADCMLFSWGSFVGGRLGVSLKSILDSLGPQPPPQINKNEPKIKTEADQKFLSIPTEVRCFQCEMKSLNDQNDQNQPKDEQPKASLREKSSVKSDGRMKQSTLGRKEEKEEKKKVVEDQGNFSFEDEEILNESSLCSEAPSDDQNQEEQDYYTQYIKPTKKQQEQEQLFDDEQLDENNESLESDERRQILQEKEKKMEASKAIKQQQDPLQKVLMKQTEDCEAENLYIQDLEIEIKIKLLYQDVSHYSLNLLTKYLIINSRIQEIMDHRCKTLAQLYQSQQLQDLKFSVPLFIIKNIQLYEAILSFMYYHPCYILKIIESQQLNKSQIVRFLDIIFRNKLIQLPNQSIMMSIAIRTFQIEFGNSQNKLEFITELKAFKSSSIFISIYIMLIRSIDRECIYFKNSAKFLIIENFFKKQQILLNLEIQENKLDQKNLHIKMQHFLNLHYDQSNFKELEKKLNCMGFIVSSYIHKIISERENAKTNNEQLISTELLFLHNEIIKIISEAIMSHENKRIQIEYNNEIADYQEKVIQKLRKFETLLWPKIHNFIIHLYYTTITDFILELQNREIDFDEEFLPFLKGGQNLKMAAQIIDRFFQKDPFLQNSDHYANINKLINDRIDFTNENMFELQRTPEESFQEKDHDEDESLDQEQIEKENEKKNLNKIKDNAIYLFSQVFFNIENLNLKEMVIRCFEVEEKYIQMEIQDILFLQNFYCNQINRHQNTKALFVRGIDDPIYIILNHLDFREVESKNFSTEILKRKINFKLNLHPLLQMMKREQNRDNVQLYKCDQCGILLTKNLLSKKKEAQIDTFLKEGWTCKKDHQNSSEVLDCEDTGCTEMITRQALKTSRILGFFQRDKDQKTDLLAYIMKNVDVIKKGEDFYKFLEQVQKTNRVKKNQNLVDAIINFIQLLTAQKPGKENVQQMKTVQEQEKEFKERFQKNYESVYSQTQKEMQTRQRHRKFQLTYQDVINQLENIMIDKQQHLLFVIRGLVEAQFQLKQRMKILNEEQAEKQDNQEEEEDEEDETNLGVKKILSFGFYTSANMIQNGSLVKITFQGKQLNKIAKNIKFYFYGQSDGGFFIHLIYLQETLLNNLVRCVKQIYQNELSLFKIIINIDQYLELKRMAKYRTQITFKKENMEVTFNILKLVSLLKYLDQRIVH